MRSKLRACDATKFDCLHLSLVVILLKLFVAVRSIESMEYYPVLTIRITINQAKNASGKYKFLTVTLQR